MGNGFISESIDFIGSNILNIIIVVLFLVLLMSYIVIHDVQFKKSAPKLERVVVVESMATGTGLDQMLRKGFCSSTLGDSVLRNKHCGEFSEKQCGSVKCCVWARQNGSKQFKCAAGDANGPTYEPMKTEEYYYLGKLRTDK
jgi:hypothetical protein